MTGKRSRKNRRIGTNRGHLFTSESVTMGHPDKVADLISDSVLDAIMAKDPGGRVACEKPSPKSSITIR